MSEQGQTAHAVEGKRHVSAQEQQERKQRVLTQGTPAIVRSIADAVVIKDENTFFLTEPDGRVPLGDDHGFGLYYHDCRFLNGYELKLAGTTPQALVSTAERGFTAVFQLTNAVLRHDRCHATLLDPRRPPCCLDGTEVHRLRVGSGHVDLSFERSSDGVAVKVLKVEGPLDVIIEPEASRAAASEAGRI